MQLSYIHTFRYSCQIPYNAYNAEIRSPFENEKLSVPEFLFFLHQKSLDESKERKVWDCKRKVIPILLLLPSLDRVQTRPAMGKVDMDIYFWQWSHVSMSWLPFTDLLCTDLDFFLVFLLFLGLSLNCLKKCIVEALNLAESVSAP